MPSQTQSTIAHCFIGCVVVIGGQFTVANEPHALPPTSFVVTTVNHQESVDGPIAKHRIVFDQGVVYDFDEINESTITVFDVRHNRVIVLDRNQKLRCTISTEHLTQLAAEVRVSADTEAKKERYGMMAAVQSAPKDQYKIQFGGVQYTTTTQLAPTKSAAMQFGQFADWGARLNMARHRGLPPFGRMSLNGAMAADGRLPHELELQIEREKDVTRLTSKHTVANTLSDVDRKRIDEISGMIALYNDVPLTELP